MDNHPPRHEPPADRPPNPLPGSRASGPDAETLGGRKRRDSERTTAPAERPTQPLIHVPDMPPGDPAPDAPPPPRERALKLADDLIHGSRRIRLAACEDMARYILAQAALDDVLELDAPTAGNITDREILEFARSLGDGTATDALARGACILALGIGGPITAGTALVRGATRDELVAQARAWCVAKIHERAQVASVGASPDPIDGPERHWGAVPTAVRNRARRAREMSGLTIRQAARRLGITADALVTLEVSPVLAVYSSTLHIVDIVDAMVRLYSVSRPWLIGDAPRHDYATVDSTPDAWRLAPRDRDELAELAAARQPRPVGADPAAAIALALAVEYDGVSLAALLVLAERDRIPGSSLLTPRQRAAVDAWLVGRCCRRDHDRDGSCYLHPGAAPTAVCGMMCDGPDGACSREPGHPPAVVAPRIWTPRDDGTCGVCGLTEGEHIEIRAEITRGVMHCQAVAP